MKKILSLWLAALMMAAQPVQAVVLVGFGQSGSAWTALLTETFDGDLSLWGSETDTNGIGAISGSNYVITQTATGQVAYLNKTFATTYQHFKIDFYIKISDVTGVGNASGQNAVFLRAGNSGNPTMYYVAARCSSSAGNLDQIQFGYHNGSAGTYQIDSFSWVADTYYHIVVEVLAADAGAGFAKMTVDESVMANITGLSTASRNFDRTSFGLQGSSTAAQTITVSSSGIEYAQQ